MNESLFAQHRIIVI